jgi:uncharacterized protein (TIGR00369 family)
MELLDIHKLEVTKNRVVLRMPVTAKTRQPMGILHGGVSIVLAETAAMIGTWMNIDHEKQMVVEVETSASHIREKRDGAVSATATPLFIDNVISVWDIKIMDEDENLICSSHCTLAIIEIREEMH